MDAYSARCSAIVVLLMAIVLVPKAAAAIMEVMLKGVSVICWSGLANHKFGQADALSRHTDDDGLCLTILDDTTTKLPVPFSEEEHGLRTEWLMALKMWHATHDKSEHGSKQETQASPNND